ncbi:3'-5' exonuclease domain-containing protein 2 [Massilia solisilvae]|uniref:3'-5' exonuclease domain-containing protein 2 n=1 Tax=Massilia solisilvae TaxID=1811225 RepID=A0ABT2BKC6_9BURK|nr:3'-5' exonuclease [Massilia solisilvae]MCS0608954.1 3'-5' exonuclease domain-containing protein 2 [Massilia solisilvae]
MSESPEELLPPYDGIKLADVRLVQTAQHAVAAFDALLAMDAIGFDTESKPTFQKGEESTGPHLVQLATDEVAYLFQIGRTAPVFTDGLRAVLESESVLKVGFGLSDDLRRLRSKLGIESSNVLDLAIALRANKRQTIGAKTAVARFFGQTMQKSKRITTTNWALPVLSEKQILYAADDAHVALRVYRRWRELKAG